MGEIMDLGIEKGSASPSTVERNAVSPPILPTPRIASLVIILNIGEP